MKPLIALFSDILWIVGAVITSTPMVDAAAVDVVAWGPNEYANGYGQKDVPIGLTNVVAIAAGFSHNLALMGQPTVPMPRLALSRGLSDLVLQAHGAPGISCQLLRASHLPGPWLPTQPVTFIEDIQFLRIPDASEPTQFFRLLRK